jgi:hypothetical protein
MTTTKAGSLLVASGLGVPTSYGCFFSRKAAKLDIMLLIIPVVQYEVVGELRMATSLNSKSVVSCDGCCYCARRLDGRILWNDRMMCPECFVEVVQDILQMKPCVPK